MRQYHAIKKILLSTCFFLLVPSLYANASNKKETVISSNKSEQEDLARENLLKAIEEIDSSILSELENALKKRR